MEHISSSESSPKQPRRRLTKEEETRLRKMLAKLAHDIANPVTAILGGLELALRHSLPEGLRENLDMCYGATRDIVELLSNIQLQASIHDGQVVRQDSSFSVSELASSIYARNVRIAERKGLTLSIQIDAACPRDVIGDVVQIKRILNNLVSNAIKYTLSGEVSLSIAYLNTTSQCLFAVKDTGIGIAEDESSKIFDIFHQAGRREMPGVEGIGLGLAIVVELIALLDGNLNVKSVLGKGSCFEVSLPLTRA